MKTEVQMRNIFRSVRAGISKGTSAVIFKAKFRLQ